MPHFLSAKQIFIFYSAFAHPYIAIYQIWHVIIIISISSDIPWIYHACYYSFYRGYL